jgi:hypothetical protein
MQHLNERVQLNKEVCYVELTRDEGKGFGEYLRDMRNTLDQRMWSIQYVPKRKRWECPKNTLFLLSRALNIYFCQEGIEMVEPVKQENEKLMFETGTQVEQDELGKTEKLLIDNKLATEKYTLLSMAQLLELEKDRTGQMTFERMRKKRRVI